MAGAQVMITAPNFYRLETSRYDLSRYNVFLETPLDNAGGRLKLPKAPGLGLAMNVDVLRSRAVDGHDDHWIAR